jgi:hypothetical protein
MSPEHHRFEELAVGHVLGGLSDDDATAFRQHLVGCRACQARVAELRDLASELAQAERQERAALRLRTETPTARALERPAEEDARRRFLRLALVAVGLIASIGLLLWNAHLRSQNATLVDTAGLREQTLATLGSGTVVPATFAGTVTGVVATDGDAIAYSLAGLPSLGEGEWLVVWLTDPDGERPVAWHSAGQLGDGRLAATVHDPVATRLRISVESTQAPTERRGAAVVDADLTVAG